MRRRQQVARRRARWVGRASPAGEGVRGRGGKYIIEHLHGTHCCVWGKGHLLAREARVSGGMCCFQGGTGGRALRPLRRAKNEYQALVRGGA